MDSNNNPNFHELVALFLLFLTIYQWHAQFRLNSKAALKILIRSELAFENYQVNVYRRTADNVKIYT